ncbi:transcriptional regulator, AraC family [Clostridium sp. DSM 8431]|nr:transcriptional regulator, AraC family [Clostridium sp. DSM 8431]
MHMNDIIKEYYNPFLCKNGFTLTVDDENNDSLGVKWKLSGDLGEGTYWIYSKANLFSIKMHDFFFYEDFLMELELNECMNLTYYESISGEEFSPYRKLMAGCIKTSIGNHSNYRALIHKMIPIRSIGIEIMPAYYEDYLKTRYSEEYNSLNLAFNNIEETVYIPELVQVLYQIKNYKGTGLAAHLFYDAKVTESLSLIIEYQKRSQKKSKKKLSDSDIHQMENLTAYLNDHYVSELSLNNLSKIACMGVSKLKSCFKQYNNCTITEYIQQRRMGHAENLLANTTLPIKVISNTIGYSNPSRFAELFKKSTGLLPTEYRKISQGI